MYFFSKFHKLSNALICIASDKDLAKIAVGASSRRHTETSPVKVKDTHLMNNKLPPAEILCEDCSTLSRDPVLIEGQAPVDASSGCPAIEWVVMTRR